MDSIHLYHYTTSEAADNMLRTGELWLTDVKSLDDANEIRNRLEKFKNQVTSSVGFNNLTFKARNLFVKNFLNKLLDEDIFIACFCTTEKNRHLWQEYGKKYTGKCLEFDLPLPVGDDPRFPLQTLPMIYRDAEVCANLQTELDKLAFVDLGEIFATIKGVREGHRRKLLHKHPNYIQCRDSVIENFIRYCLGSKSKKFEEEREWRLIASKRFETWFDESKICYENGKRVMKFPIPEGFFTGTVYNVDVPKQ